MFVCDDECGCFRKSKREELESSWILFGMSLLQDPRLTIMLLKEPETFTLDGKNLWYLFIVDPTLLVQVFNFDL